MLAATAYETKGLLTKHRLRMKQKSIIIDDRKLDILPSTAAFSEVKTGKCTLIEFILSGLVRTAQKVSVSTKPAENV